MLRRARSQTGQTAAEYLGALLLVSVVIAAVVSGPGPKLAGHVSHLVDCIAGGGCSSTGASDGGTPAPNAAPTPTIQLADAPSAPATGVPTPPPSAPATPTMPQPSGAPTTTGVPTPQAGGGGPVATPQAAPPGPAPTPPPAPWTGQAANLPQTGDRPYVPPKSSRGQPKKVPAGTRGNAKGFEDADGNVWIWNPPGSPTAHGGPHWDVQHKDGSHTNVNPDGSVRGPDNFPNKSRGGNSGGSDGDKGGDTGKIVAGTAAGVGAGALIWWGAKLLSPACGPFAPFCAIAF